MVTKLKASKAGFTLVELIVVIAILGILAGISVPVYSGYIEKAHRASDLQLLGTINTAFSAACAEMRVDPSEVNAVMTLTGATGDKKVGSVTASGSGGAVDGLNEAFFRYFAGNEDKTFKQYGSLLYNRAEGVFKGTDWELSYADGVYSVKNSKGETISVTEENRAALLASTFGTAMSIGELMDDVDDVAAAAAGLFTALGKDADSVANFMDGTGSGSFHNLLVSMGLGEDATSEELANAVILDVARRTSSIDADTLLDIIQGETFFGSMEEGHAGLESFGSGGGATAAGTALFYAIAEGFANSEVGKTAIVYDMETGDEIGTAYDYLQSVTAGLSGSSDLTSDQAFSRIGDMFQFMSVTDEFSTYLETSVADDISGYLASMQTIQQNVSSGQMNLSTYACQGMTGEYMSEIMGLLFGN